MAIEGYQEKFAIEVSEVLNSVKELSDKIEKVPINRVFEKVIGYDKSLAEPIEQLKTAVFYPNNGLPVMVMGIQASEKVISCKSCMNIWSKQKFYQKQPHLKY